MPAGMLGLAGMRSEAPGVRGLCLPSLLSPLLTDSARAGSRVGCAGPAAPPPSCLWCQEMREWLGRAARGVAFPEGTCRDVTPPVPARAPGQPQQPQPFCPYGQGSSLGDGFRSCISQPLLRRLKNRPVAPCATSPRVSPVPSTSNPSLPCLSCSVIPCPTGTPGALWGTAWHQRAAPAQRLCPSWFFIPSPSCLERKILKPPRTGRQEEVPPAGAGPRRCCSEPGCVSLKPRCHGAEAVTPVTPLPSESSAEHRHQRALLSPSPRRSSPSWCSAPSSTSAT